MQTLERPVAKKNGYSQILSSSDYLGTITGTSVTMQDDRWNMLPTVTETNTRSEGEKVLTAIVLKFNNQFKTLKNVYEANEIFESHVKDKFAATFAYLLTLGGQSIDVSLTEEFSINFSAKISNIQIYAEYFLVYDIGDPEDEEIIITLDNPENEIISFGGDFNKTWNAVLAKL